MINRTQALVLGFFGLAWVAFVVILLLAPQIYDQTLKLSPGEHGLADLAFLVALSGFLVVLSNGVVRRWRWTFWLILVAFLAGVLRIPASALELFGVLPPSGPAWYAVFQAAVGLVQVAIGLAMLARHRRAGTWDAF